MSDNNKDNRRSVAPDLEALTRAYEESLNAVTLGGKNIPTPETKRPKTQKAPIGELKNFVPEDYMPDNNSNSEHDKIVDKIREDRRKRSHSVWTDTPVLKPRKSIWIDDGTSEIDSAAVRQAAMGSSAAGPSAKRRADRDIITPLPVMTEQPKETEQPVRSAQNVGQEGDAVVPLLNEKPHKQELVMKVDTEGETQVRSLPRRSNKKKVTVDMSGYREMPEREKAPEREETPNKRTVALEMPISKVNLDDLPVPEKKRTAKKAEAPAEEEKKSAEDEETGLAGKAVGEEEPGKAADADTDTEQGEENSLSAENESEQEEAAEENEQEKSEDGEYNFSAMIKKVRTEKKDKVREEYDHGGVSEHTLITEKAQRHGVEPQYIMKPSKLGKRKKPKTHELEFQFINSIMCVGVVFTIFFSLLFMERESGFINSENRDLAEFPVFSVSDYFSGKYTKGINDYFTDTISGREEMKKFGSFFDKMKGIDLGGTKVSGTHKQAEKETFDGEKLATVTTVTANTDPKASTTAASGSSETTTTSKEEVVELPEELGDGVLEGEVVVFGKGKNVRAVGGYYGMFETTAEYAHTVNKYKDAMPDINVYNMTIPTATSFYMPDNFKDAYASQKDNIDNITAELDGIVSAYVYDTLYEHKDEYIYARTDHHWQPLGAYYAGKVFADVAGVKYPKLDSYEKVNKEGWIGTMYSYSNYDQELYDNPDVYTYYKPRNDYTTTYYDTAYTYGVMGDLFFEWAEGVNCYGTVLGRDEQIVEIETDVNNGRTLVIFKDSYGNALVPFLTGSFEKIYVCDFRYFDENAIEFCRYVGCTDLLFAISITSCSNDIHIQAINNDRVQDSPAIADIRREQLEDERAKTETTTDAQPEPAEKPSEENDNTDENNDELGG